MSDEIRYVGIDPGTGGGIACLDAAGQPLYIFKMPDNEQDLLTALRTCASARCRAALELVRSSPQMGVVSAFTFGQGVGRLRMALVAAGIPFDEVTPRRWQQAIGCRMPKGIGQELGKRDTVSAKNHTKQRAVELFPQARITHATADALLLAEYCRRQWEQPTGAAATQGLGF